MDLEMVLNELSLNTGDILTARQLMSELIGTLRQATASGVKRVLRTSEEINSLELAPNYPIFRWRNDPEVDREESRFFKTLVTKAPFWNDVFENFRDEFDLLEVRHQGEQANGIGFALVIDGLPVSFNSENRWNHSYLSLEVIRIDADQELAKLSKLYTQVVSAMLKNTEVGYKIGFVHKLLMEKNFGIKEKNYFLI